MTFENIIVFINKHIALRGLGAIGLVIAVLMLVIGFFRTLLLVVLTLLFGVYGYFIDKLGFRGANKAIANLFRRKRLICRRWTLQTTDFQNRLSFFQKTCNRFNTKERLFGIFKIHNIQHT